MLEKKVKNISISLNENCQNLLATASKRLDKTKSSIVQDLISIYLDTTIGEYDDIPVLIRIPFDLKDNPDKIHLHIEEKFNSICERIKLVK